MTPAHVATAAAMRAACNTPGDYRQITVWVSAALHAHLSRYGRDWKMELSDETPIATEDAHAWARAMGAPDGTPVLAACGGVFVVAQWEDAAFDPAPPVGATYWQAQP